MRPPPALAADALEQHTTGSYQVSFSAPAGWPVSEQELQGSRYLYIAADPTEPDSANVVLTFQPLAADYTSLGSFGTQELVGNSLDRMSKELRRRFSCIGAVTRVVSIPEGPFF